jgi:transcription factor RLM1
MSHPSGPPPQSELQHSPPLPSQPHVTEIKSTSKRIKSINTPVSSRASSLAAHFDTSRAQYDRPAPPPGRSHSVDSSAQQQIVSNLPLSHSPPPITTNTPGSTTNSAGGRPKLSLHIPDDEDPTQQGDESGGEATPGTASPEVQRGDSRQEIKTEHPSEGDRDRNTSHESFFLPPPSSSLPNGRLPGPGLGAFDNTNNSGGTPLSALPSRYAGDMLPSPSTFYPDFYGTLPSAGTSNVRGGFGGLMNGTPVVTRSDDTFGGSSSYGGSSGEKRRSEDGLAGINKRARN